MYNGVLYDSMREASYAQELDLRLKAKDIKSWIGDKKALRFQISLNGVKICTYTPDFLVINNDGTAEYIDVKGVRTTAFNLKWRLVKAQHPNFNFKIVK